MNNEQAQMMRMMQQMLAQTNGQPGAQGPGGPQGAPGDMSEDPMFKMMQQMMGGQMGQEQQQPPPSSAYAWRIVHALFAAVLALYVGLESSFTGSELARTNPQAFDGDGKSFAQRLFYIFATTELVLQSTRYFMEKGQLQGSGILSTLSSFLPQPYGNYVRVVGRYSVIYTTIMADAMVVVFVLGFLAWWKGTST